MKVIIPHKDTLFILSKTAKSFISFYNSQISKSIMIPVFPLWAFINENIIDTANICDVQIEKPIWKDREFFFPLVICSKNIKKEYKIIFARLKKDFNISEWEDFFNNHIYENNDFPLKMRIFKLGDINITNNNYQSYNEKWVKLKNS